MATATEPSVNEFRGDAFTASSFGLSACTACGSVAWLSGSFQIGRTAIVRTSTRCAHALLWTDAPDEYACCSIRAS
ncbi:MAG TPA: hypothetical protein VGR62_02185 [Candidatus Binatia bacterium]|nr:hypothetical protein [Candidatus Binatia bacterium]